MLFDTKSPSQLKKVELRQHILRELQSISGTDKRQKSFSIQKNLATKLGNKSGNWSAYQSMSTEPEISWTAVSTDIQWCFPKIENKQMIFQKSVSQFKKNEMGFAEPIDGETVPLDKIAGFIVPGLAFDYAGHRLGRGRGFYDITLKNIKDAAIVGICFQSTLKDIIPFEDHDLKCHLVITENQSVVIEGVHQWN